jgi:ethanolamine utilization protein EutN
MAVVTGAVVAPQKDESLNPFKLLIVHQIDENFRQYPNRQDEVALDQTFGAGIGDAVLLTQGSPARVMLDSQSVPVDLVVAGIIDSIETEDGHKYARDIREE